MEKIARGVNVSIFNIITSAVVLLMICCFVYWRHTSGAWEETSAHLAVCTDILDKVDQNITLLSNLKTTV